MARYYGGPAVAAGSSLVQLTTAPDGGFDSWGGGAFRANAITVIPYTDSSGFYQVRTYPDSTHTLSAKTTFGGPTTDDWHNTAQTIRRSSDGKYVAVFMAHNTATPLQRISTNADDATSWASTTGLDASLGGTSYTYPFLAQLGDETNDPIYLIYRDTAGGVYNWRYSKSTDGGASWAAQTTIWAQNTGYLRAVKTSESRIDFIASNGSGQATTNSSVYHFYYDGTWHKSDGTALTLPATPANTTQVYDGTTNGTRAPHCIVNDGTEIAVTFPVWTSSTTQAYKYARYTAGTWTVRTPVADCGTDGYPGSYAWIEGGCQIDPADIDHVVLSKVTSGAWRIWEYTTADAGASWTTTQITSTGDDDFYPVFIVDYESTGLQYLFLKGTATAYTDFSVGIWGVSA